MFRAGRLLLRFPTDVRYRVCWIVARDARILGYCLMVWLLASHSALALEIKDVRWGFDGKVVRHRFNVLSILVDNPQPVAFDGEYRVQKHTNSGQDVDAPLIEPVYVGPFARKWVQFYPYVGADYEGFSVQEIDKEGRRAPRVKLPDPQRGWPARVLIEPASTPALRGVPVKRFPDELFPPFVTATDSLQALLIDSVPDWAEPRRQAFLEWLYKGGTVFVLQTVRGQYPDFPSSLKVLDGPLDLSTYGAGRVYRVALSRQGLNKESLTDLFANLPKRLVVNYEGETKELSAVDLENSEESTQGFNSFADSSDPLSSRSFLGTLKEMTRPEHNWPLLHLMFWVYIGLVFPGCWLLGRKYSDYRVVYLALLATVGVFSVLFAIVGQRGYGEATAVNTTAILQTLPDGQVDVAGWTNVFVTSGGDYEIRHTGNGTLYSTCNFNEYVSGIILNGADANFFVDMPPFSSREFAYRMRLPLTMPKFRWNDFTQVSQGKLPGQSLESSIDLPAEMENIVLLYGTSFYTVGRQGRKLTVGGNMGGPEGYLRINDQNQWQYNYQPWRDSEKTAMEHYRDLLIPLITREMNISSRGDAQAFQLSPYVARLIYFAPLPDELKIQNPYLGKQDGWGIYVIDVPMSESPRE